MDGLSFPLLLLFCLSSCNELVSDVCIFRWQCPAEALPLPLGVPLKSTIQRLKKEVLHLTKKLKKSEGELRQAKKCYSEAAAEAAHFRSLQVKAIMDYSRRKANFAKELEECMKSASDRTWAQEARISALKVELSAAKRRIGQLEGNSSRLTARDEQIWSQKVSDLQKQLQDAEMSHDVQRASWRRQVEEHKGRFRRAADEVVRLQKQLVTRAQLTNAQDTEELRALRGTIEGISVSLGEKTAELQQVKIQLGLERKAVTDAEAESEVLRKWHREAEAESWRLRQALQDMLQKKEELEEIVETLRQSWSGDGGDHPMLEGAGPP